MRWAGTLEGVVRWFPFSCGEDLERREGDGLCDAVGTGAWAGDG